MDQSYHTYLAFDLLHELQTIEMNMAYELTLLPTYVHNNDFRQIAAIFKTFETDETYIQNLDISLLRTKKGGEVVNFEQKKSIKSLPNNLVKI